MPDNGPPEAQKQTFGSTYLLQQTAAEAMRQRRATYRMNYREYSSRRTGSSSEQAGCSSGVVTRSRKRKEHDTDGSGNSEPTTIDGPDAQEGDSGSKKRGDRVKGSLKQASTKKANRRTNKITSQPIAAKERKKRGPAAVGRRSVPDLYSRLAPPTTCKYCGAKKFSHESKGLCCGKGSIRIAKNDYPRELIELFTKNDAASVHFQTYARLYNNMFAFSSLGGQFDAKIHKGIYVFKLHGQIYHFVPDLIPQNADPKYLQLYFYDAQSEKENRVGLFAGLQESIVQKLMDVMNNNPYASFFRSLRNINVSQETQIVLNHNPVLDQRVYNAPTSDDVAAVWSDASSSSASSGPHIIVKGKSDQVHRIKHYYGCYDPLQYPLLFPRGECGWHQGIQRYYPKTKTFKDNRTFPIDPAVNQEEEDLIAEEVRGEFQYLVILLLLWQLSDRTLTPQTVDNAGSSQRKGEVSCREYYAYLLQVRQGNYLLGTLRLFQQYIVDLYVKIENTRLDFLRKNQDTIRADLYQGILDTVQLGESNAANVGHRIILPPSFIGGPRDMKRRYLNSMALVHKYGKPDLFLTITCNPNWPEIQEELSPPEQSCHRPDIVARIFNAKLITLRKLIMDNKIFGEVAAMIHVVEFQKRGLPHAHFLIILKPEFKIKIPEQFDNYVCAEIPTEENPHLRRAVLQHMVHGPCGVLNEKCPCMKREGCKLTCQKSYPKSFCELTTTGKDSYPIYQRRNTGEVVRVRGADLDNRWIVPYNPYLLARFDCHLNVEVCSTVKAVKYLYKYVYKGHDRVSFKVAQTDIVSAPVNEIEQYQSGRWVSPPEAAWRIFGFKLFSIYPSVLPLQVHLPNMQSVRFDSNEQLNDIISDKRRGRTMLTEFFRMNAESTSSRALLYSEFPQKYVWDVGNRIWKVRNKGLLVGRLTYTAPSEGERYFLRLLLTQVPGPTSFEDILTVNGQRCETFQQSALRRGLLETNESLDHCMVEAIQNQMPQSLRHLLATILVFCYPSDPRRFWDTYYPHLSEDFQRQFPNDPARVLGLTAQKVEQYLEGMGKSFNDYGLKHLHDLQGATLRQARDITDALEALVPDECILARKQLNAEQRVAYKCIIQRVKSGVPGAFFIDGPGGTGKTFLYCALYAKVRLLGKICIPTATSGIAASNIPSGRTAHSRFKIPVDNNGSVGCDVAKQSSVACVLREASLIIWDEASMALRENIEGLDTLLQDLCSNQLLFGGKVIVFGGDFRQVLPVLPRKTQQEAVEASLVSSFLWPLLTKFKLTQNVRAREDMAFSSFLLKLGSGELQSEGTEAIQVPQELIIPWDDSLDSVNKLAAFTYPEIKSKEFDPQIFTQRAILTPKNDQVDKINSLMIERFPGTVVLYRSYDKMIDDNCSLYPTEFLNTLCPGGMSPHELKLKIDCPVILLRNLDPSAGLCNGTRLICKSFAPNMITCEIATGCYAGQRVFLPRITLKPSTSVNYPFQFQRAQFPIKLSFAMTINKAQGQTLQQVGIHLPSPCFSHGQLYVALSRAKKSSQLRIMAKPSRQESETKVQNVVAFEVLRRAAIL